MVHPLLRPQERIATMHLKPRGNRNDKWLKLHRKRITPSQASKHVCGRCELSTETRLYQESRPVRSPGKFYILQFLLPLLP